MKLRINVLTDNIEHSYPITLDTVVSSEAGW